MFSREPQREPVSRTESKMLSTWNIALSALQIIFLLDSLFAQSTGFHQPPECTEYYNEIENITPSIQLRGTGKTTVTPSEEDGEFHHLVVGGKDAKIESFPHVVALGKFDEDAQFSFHCGGSIISPKWVLTAAHCTHGLTGGVTIARLGIQRLNDTNGQTIPIKRTIRHPFYRPPAMYGDIALLELSRSVSFSKTGIKPACLHQQYDEISSWVWVCGWGATEFAGGESNTLQEAQLQLVSDFDCAIKHDRSIQVPIGIVSSVVCAGAPNNNWQQDTCHGDSGGPLQVSHPTYSDYHQIVGITSFGAGCAFTDSSGVYTRVSHYLNWIENIVWPRYS